MSARHLYLHIPFCARRCSYCDFAIAVRREVPSADYLTALQREIAIRFPDGPVEEVDTIYLGGGTPSRLGATAVARLLDALRSHWTLAPAAEVTLEVNPEDVDSAAASAWRSAGVTRISLGVQSFDDGVLRWMHRSHDGGGVIKAVESLRDAGFDSWSLDLIFALPPSLARDWPADLEQAIALNPPHVSCYGLTFEPRTPLARWHSRRLVREAEEETFEQEFLAAHGLFVAEGFEHYEVSNYARPGYRSRHNGAYWSRLSYLGLGPSAHGFDGVRRRWNEREYASWGDRLHHGEDPLAGEEQLSAEQEADEIIYLGLRTSTGVLVSPVDRPMIDVWRSQGWARSDGTRVQLTPTGWLRLDALASALTDCRSRY